jgi:hypothetical protein
MTRLQTRDAACERGPTNCGESGDEAANILVFCKGQAERGGTMGVSRRSLRVTTLLRIANQSAAGPGQLRSKYSTVATTRTVFKI